MIILDKQHLSQLQLVGTISETRLSSRLKAVRGEDIRITIISPFEQFREVLGRINASSTRPAEQIRHLRALGKLMHFYAPWNGRIRLFDQAAAEVFRQFTPELIRRIGSSDARIAAIARVHAATLLSSNLRDFQQVPGLRVEDWLRD